MTARDEQHQDAVARLIARTRTDRGLPARINDDVVISQVAALLAGRNGTRTGDPR